LIKTAGIYIHIPFCVKRCNYCDFTSFTKLNFIPPYIDALKREIALRANEGIGLTFDSIYFGGGTPSLLEITYLQSVIDKLYKYYKISKEVEITIEANPESVTLQKLKCYKKLSINRLSIGVQSFDDKVLNCVERIHNSEKAIEAIQLAREASFDNLNLDLIVGLPESNMNTFKVNINALKQHKPEHISLYILMRDKNTKLSKNIENGLISLPSDSNIEYYWRKYMKFLKAEDYNHYEISNFSKEGYICKHNLHYWLRDPYIGFGVSASSFINDERATNTKKLNLYIDRLNKGFNPATFREKISTKKKRTEEIMLGLRLINKGISKELIRKDKEEIVNNFIDLKLLKENCGNLCLTGKGLILSNQIIASLM
jgi:oxygen-independent coproporphyrinogen-3 oxidase